VAVARRIPARRPVPGEHLNKSLNEIKDALKKASDKDKSTLQKAKKI
jgi:hypothetical protein